MSFSIIAAIDNKKGIGKNNQLPWQIKADLKHFTDLTINKKVGKQNSVIMGRKTWESLPEKFRPLKNRLNIVLSKQSNLDLPSGVLNFTSLDEALNVLYKQTIGKIFIIGGGSLYDEAIQHPDCRNLYLTEIKANFDCDTYFPEIPADYKKIEESEIQKEENYEFCYLTYQR